MYNLPLKEIARHEHGPYWALFSTDEQDAIRFCASAYSCRERVASQFADTATTAILREEVRAMERYEADLARGIRPEPSREAVLATEAAKKADAVKKAEREAFRTACREAGLTAPMSQAKRAHLLGIWRRTGRIEA